MGGGSVFLNIKVKRYLVNDIDINIINLYKILSKFNICEFFDELFKIIIYYGLFFFFKGIIVFDELKK